RLIVFSRPRARSGGLDLTRAVAPELLERCIEIAFQAPTGSNAQGWHFVIVRDPERRRRLDALYRKGFELLGELYGSDGPYSAGDLRARQFPRMHGSAAHLMEPLHEG